MRLQLTWSVAIVIVEREKNESNNPFSDAGGDKRRPQAVHCMAINLHVCP